MYNTKDILQLTWKKITTEIIKCEEELKKFLLLHGKFNRIALRNSIKNGNDAVFVWFWKKHMKLFKTNEEFTKLVFESDSEASTLLSAVFVFASIAKIDVVCREIHDRKFDEDTLINIFTSLTSFKRNLLMHLTCRKENALSVIEHGWNVIHEILGVKVVGNLCQALDARGYNLLLQVAQGHNKAALDFCLTKIHQYVSGSNILKILEAKNQKHRNILQLVLDNQDPVAKVENFKFIWKFLISKFGKGIKKFLVSEDMEKSTVLKDLEQRRESQKEYKDIENFLKEEMKKVYNEVESKEILEGKSEAKGSLDMLKNYFFS